MFVCESGLKILGNISVQVNPYPSRDFSLMFSLSLNWENSSSTSRKVVSGMESHAGNSRAYLQRRYVKQETGEFFFFSLLIISRNSHRSCCENQQKRHNYCHIRLFKSCPSRGILVLSLGFWCAHFVYSSRLYKRRTTSTMKLKNGLRVLSSGM